MNNEPKANVPFTMQEFNTFIDLLGKVDDRGPEGEGWQSDELIALTLKLKQGREELKCEL